MTKKTILAYFRYTRSAVSAITELEKKFLEAFKRRPDVDLFYGEHSKPDVRPVNRYVVAYFTGDRAESDINWFLQLLNKEDYNQIIS